MGSKLWFDYSSVGSEAAVNSAAFDAVFNDMLREIDRMKMSSQVAVTQPAASLDKYKVESCSILAEKSDNSGNGTEAISRTTKQLSFDPHWLSSNRIRLKNSFGSDEIDEICTEELRALKHSAHTEISFVEFLIAHVTEDTTSALRLLKFIDSPGRRK